MASIYRIISTGDLVPADQPYCEQHYPDDWEYVGEEPEPVITERFISGVEFLRRFTPAQRIAIRTLTKTDPIADDFMRLLDATIAQGSGVNLMDQDTIDGVGYLAATIPDAAIDPAVILA